jgi:hypothetical protein
MLIKGENLNTKQIEQVLSTFVNRWTIENKHNINSAYKRRKEWIIQEKGLRSDKEWIEDHAFYFLKDGSRLMLNRKYCILSVMVD